MHLDKNNQQKMETKSSKKNQHEKEMQQRNEFRNILFELAKSQEKLEDAYYRSDMYKRLELLYDSPFQEKPFRHFYSDIFSVLTQINENPELGNINILGQNLDEIRDGYNPKNVTDGRTIDVSDSIKKLYDHVNLDMARILYLEAGDKKTSGEEAILNLQSQISAMSGNINNVQKSAEETILNLQSQIGVISESINNVQKNAEEKISIVSESINTVQKSAEEKISNQQKEYISILGIFAAVVLAFTAGIAFSTSVLENISQASIYRTIIMALIIGLVLVNILFGLFFYISKIVSKEEKILPLIIANVIMVGLIIVTVIAWSFGLVEARNKRIYDTEVTYEKEQLVSKNNINIAE